MRVTVPGKPFTGTTKIVEAAYTPTAAGPGEEAVMLKSTTFTVITAVVWTSELLVPVTVTV